MNVSAWFCGRTDRDDNMLDLLGIRLAGMSKSRRGAKDV